MVFFVRPFLQEPSEHRGALEASRLAVAVENADLAHWKFKADFCGALWHLYLHGWLTQNAPLHVWAKVFAPHSGDALDPGGVLGWELALAVAPKNYGLWAYVEITRHGCGAAVTRNGS